MSDSIKIAYLSMEIAAHPSVPTYSGGLGILAGDTVRSFADLHVPAVAITLLARHGYFHQSLSAEGKQTESPEKWEISDFLKGTTVRASVEIQGRTVHLKSWQYDVVGRDGFVVPVYFLDCDVPENAPQDRRLTDHLYGGDNRYRLCQEVVLGMGGLKMLRALGHDRVQRYHLNEGHAALVTLALADEIREDRGVEKMTPEIMDDVRRMCVFTTHTPVPAGHDRFSLDLVKEVIGQREACGVDDSVCHAGELNMTFLALSLSHYVNGVASKHRDVSQLMFADYQIDSIVNGVHAQTWTSDSMAELYDRLIPDWREDNFSLRAALSIPNHDIWVAHQASKRTLLQHIHDTTKVQFDPDVLTLGFARRATSYKRPTLLLSDIERLKNIAREAGAVQIVYAGKAHPKDNEGKRLIAEIVQHAGELAGEVPIVYLPNYDMRLGKLLTSGVDVWLNTPEPPLEASGTSGMKAALNGVPSLSVLDGWWIEGCLEGVTGWAIGKRNQQVHSAHAESLYDKLENVVVPLFYKEHERFVDVMRQAIALNGSFFNTQRMVHEYLVKSYTIGNPISEGFA